MNTFKIYIPVNKNVRIGKWGIMALIVIICVSPMLFERHVLEIERVSWFSTIMLAFYMVAVPLALLYFTVAKFYKKEQLKGILKGDLIFTNTEIIIENKVHPIQDIKNVSFVCFDDYVGRKDTSRYSLKGISNGVDNAVELYFSNGKKVTYHFQMTERYELRDIREQLIAYHKAGKLHFLNLIDVLGIEDYNAIQNFKNTLSIKSY